MVKNTEFALFSIAIIVLCLLVGTQIAYFYGKVRTATSLTTSISTVTTTSEVTKTYSYNGSVAISGSVSSAVNIPIAVEFWWAGCIDVGQKGPPFVNCIPLNSSYVYGVNTTRFTLNNQTYFRYSGSYNVSVPNDLAYSVRVVLNNTEGIMFSSPEAALLPLYTNSWVITSYNIVCVPTLPNFTIHNVSYYTTETPPG
jgi:hypothetical protein